MTTTTDLEQVKFNSIILSCNILKDHIDTVFKSLYDVTDAEQDQEFQAYILKATSAEMLDKVLERVTVEMVARRFSELLSKYLVIEEIKSINQINKHNPDSCATHDYCDANIYMDEALKDSGFDAMSEDEALKNTAEAMWFKAWSTAKRNNFYI